MYKITERNKTSVSQAKATFSGIPFTCSFEWGLATGDMVSLEGEMPLAPVVGVEYMYLAHAAVGL